MSSVWCILFSRSPSFPSHLLSVIVIVRFEGPGGGGSSPAKDQQQAAGHVFFWHRGKSGGTSESDTFNTNTVRSKTLPGNKTLAVGLVRDILGNRCDSKRELGL